MNAIRRLLPLVVLSAAVAALGAALVGEHVFGLRPCELCIAQRVPFAAAGLFAVAALLRPRLSRPLMALAGLALLVNAGIAVYHVGVERHWWVSACSGGSSGPLDVGDLAAQMSRPAPARCDEPAWAWHGITMAGFNIPYSGGLALLTLLALPRRKESL